MRKRPGLAHFLNIWLQNEKQRSIITNLVIGQAAAVLKTMADQFAHRVLLSIVFIICCKNAEFEKLSCK